MPITREEIAWSYRLILGREATEHDLDVWRDVPSLAEMRRLCLTSGEFRSSLDNSAADTVDASLTNVQSRLPIDVPPQPVEWRTDAVTEARLVDLVMRTWTQLGYEKPHWSVLSSEHFLPDRIEETKNSFYASGANDVSRIVSALARHGVQPSEFARVVEFGCGVGRVTPHLARQFAHVVGVDSIGPLPLDRCSHPAHSALSARSWSLWQRCGRLCWPRRSRRRRRGRRKRWRRWPPCRRTRENPGSGG